MIEPRDEWVEEVMKRLHYDLHPQPHGWQDCAWCGHRAADLLAAVLPLIEQDVLCADGPTAYWRGLLDGMERERDEARAGTERLREVLSTEAWQFGKDYPRLLEERDRALAEVEKWHAACDEQGIPRTVEALIKQHRASQGMIVAAELIGEREQARAEVERLRADRDDWRGIANRQSNNRALAAARKMHAAIVWMLSEDFLDGDELLARLEHLRDETAWVEGGD